MPYTYNSWRHSILIEPTDSKRFPWRVVLRSAYSYRCLKVIACCGDLREAQNRAAVASRHDTATA
jgi:hypothetical protein